MATKDKDNGSTATAEKKDYVSVSVSMPQEMRDKLEAKASEGQLSLSIMARRVLAEQVGFDVSIFERTHSRGRTSYGSEEEREKARKQASEDRANKVAALMKLYNEGEIEIPDDVLESVRSRPKRGKKAEKTEQEETATATA